MSRKHSLLFCILYNLPVMYRRRKKHKKLAPTRPHPVRSRKLLGHAYMSHVAEMLSYATAAFLTVSLN